MGAGRLRVTAHRGATATTFDLGRDAPGRGEISALAVNIAAQVIDQDGCSLGGEIQRVGPAEAASRTGHYDDSSFERLAHRCPLSWTSGPVREPAGRIRFEVSR